MRRIILIDDSPSARTLIGGRLREHGFDVLDAPDATTGAELAMSAPPDAIVTDLWMPGISGLQLCRLMRADPSTAKVPVVLLTATDDRRTRFWAKCAGAAAFVTKTEIDRLITLLHELSTGPASPATSAPSPFGIRSASSIPERLSQLLDSALYDSTIAGEVRALAHFADVEQLFHELARVTSDVASYRWMGLTQVGYPNLMLHSTRTARVASEREARDALEIPRDVEERRKNEDPRIFLVEDGRPLGGEGGAALVSPILFGDEVMGHIALAPTRRGASMEDKRLLEIVASELGGPLRMVRLVSEARRLAAIDPLTGLLNRRAFLETVAQDRYKPDKNTLPWSVLLLDIDHFKKVNDTYGHDAGDAVIQGVASVLAKIARKSDHVARWGGEEFVVALVQTADAGARIAAERVRRAIAETRITLPSGEAFNVTASVGLASAATTEWELTELIARADKAMYGAKHRGRNRVEMG